MVDVLVIDFDPEVREQASIALNGGVFELTFASDGLEAIKVARAKTFDLILVDMLLPGAVSSFDVIQRLRTVSPQSPVLAICDASGGHVAEAALRAGAGDVVFKPVDSSKIDTAAKKFLQKKYSFAQPVPATPERSTLRLPEIPLLGNFSMTEKEQLLSLGEKVNLKARENFQFDGRQGVVIMYSGAVKTCLGTCFAGILSAGHSIGEASLFLKSEEPLIISLTAVEETIFYHLRKTVLKEYFQVHGKSLLLRFSVNVIACLSQKLAQSNLELARKQADMMLT